ncbi:MAG: hypothetical protein ABIF04_07230 [Chloroflexota bacterium]
MSNRKLSGKRRALLCELESIIGDLCFGSFIQNYGPGGVLESEGRWIRYPVTFKTEEAGLIADGMEVIKVKKKDEVKTKYPCSKRIPEGMLLEGFYKFGANELHILKALDDILTRLEKKYNVSFD